MGIWKYRKKGDRLIIEEDRKYRMTLPKDASELFKILNGLRQAKSEDLRQTPVRDNEEEEAQKCAYELLTEHKNKDAKAETPEEIIRKAKEAQNKLMEEVLGK